MLRNKSSKILQGLYAEYYKMLMKEIKDLNKWRNVPCSWIRRLNVVKMSILPRLIYRFTAIPIRIPVRFFLKDIGKSILKCILKGKGTRV